MAVPGVALVLGAAELVLEVFEHPEIVQRVEVAGDHLGQRPDPAPRRRALGQEGRRRMGLVEVFEDRHGLDQCGVAIFEHRHQLLRIEGREGVGELRAAILQQVHRGALGHDPLEVQADTDAEAGR